MKHLIFLHLLLTCIVSFFIVGCSTTESHKTLTPQRSAAAKSFYQGPREPIVVGNFQNRSNYLRGVFSTGDRLGSQAKTILKSHLNLSNRFTVVDRDNTHELQHEANIRGIQQTLTGAKVAVSGDVTEFGRKNVGDQQLFGILGKGKKQIAYAKVTLNLVSVETSEILFTAQGAGEYQLAEREVVGFGTKAGYDATLNGKVLDLAVREAVDRLVEGLEQGAWSF